MFRFATPSTTHLNAILDWLYQHGDIRRTPLGPEGLEVDQVSSRECQKRGTPSDQQPDSSSRRLAGSCVTNFHKLQGQLRQRSNQFMHAVPHKKHPLVASLLFDRARADGTRQNKLSGHPFGNFLRPRGLHPSMIAQLYPPLEPAKQSAV